MSNRRLLGAGLGLALVVCGVLCFAVSADDESGSRGGLRSIVTRHKVMRYGGPVEKTLRVVPTVHAKFWPPLILTGFG